MVKNKTINLDNFFDSTMMDIEKKIKTTISDKEIVEILNGGKRLRSLLSTLSFKACTQGKESKEKYQQSLEGNVGIELAHGASLVHDDIIDKDVERRGKPAFHVKKGVGKAILTGHKMLITGLDIALKHGKEFSKLYLDSWSEVVNGEINEVDFNKNGVKIKTPSTKSQIFEAYNKIINLKTASLFSSACKGGALEANMSEDVLKVFAEYGREIGLAYQLADDLVDLAKGEFIDSVILPIVNKLEKQTTEISALKKEQIKNKFDKNKEKIKEVYIKEIKKHIGNAVQLGKSELIPTSEYKDLLSTAPSYIINKMLREISLTV